MTQFFSYLYPFTMLTNCTILNTLLMLMNSRLTMLNYLPTLLFGCEIDILNIRKTELSFPFNNLLSWSFFYLNK